jgi:DNA-binding transcriptional ArsR family regulator
MLVRRHTLSECEIHQILSNPRRRAVLDHLGASPGAISVRDLSEAIAATETGESPAPTRVRESVYTSLHQTHLPKLQELGVVRYDRDRSEIRPLAGVRAVDPYMEVVTTWGVTWGEYYRALGVLGLTVVVAALTPVPFVSLVDPLLWASGFLALFALSSAYQLWRDRYALVRTLRAVSGARRSGVAVADGGDARDEE